MSLQGLFGRAVAVEIGPEGGPGVRLADLRVSFRCTYKAGKVGTGTVNIYNASPTSAGLLRQPRATIRLLAGYVPSPRLLFQGTPDRDGVVLAQRGADRVLEVDATDGGRGYVETFLNVSFATATTFGQVLTTILSNTQWSRGFIDPAVESVALPHGIALTCRPSEAMARLAAAVPPAGADWFVRDNALYVVARGRSTPETAPLISSTQGNLIGPPTTTKNGIKLRALIDATMRPGRTIIVQSVGINGTYVARDVAFVGDSGWDSEFYMEITAKPVGVP